MATVRIQKGAITSNKTTLVLDGRFRAEKPASKEMDMSISCGDFLDKMNAFEYNDHDGATKAMAQSKNNVRQFPVVAQQVNPEREQPPIEPAKKVEPEIKKVIPPKPQSVPVQPKSVAPPKPVEKQNTLDSELEKMNEIQELQRQELKKLRRALYTANYQLNWYRTSFKHSTEGGLFVSGDTLKIKDVNSAISDVINWPPEHIVHKPLATFIYSEDQPLLQTFAMSMYTGNNTPMTFRFVGSDRKLIPVSVSGSVVHGSSAGDGLILRLERV